MKPLTAENAIRELYYILDSAMRTGGAQAVNDITMTGRWYVYTDQEAEQLVRELRALLTEVTEAQENATRIAIMAQKSVHSVP